MRRFDLVRWRRLLRVDFVRRIRKGEHQTTFLDGLGARGGRFLGAHSGPSLTEILIELGRLVPPLMTYEVFDLALQTRAACGA